jgi:N-acetylmuramic acid 6-phosphate (MurNAc-6-P) etherase
MQQSFENSEQIVDQLKFISDQLADRALSVLKEAHAAGESKRPEAERTLTQARRAVEKAISLLTRG